MTPLAQRNSLRLQVLELDVQRNQMLQIPVQYRNNEKINTLELKIIELETQIKQIEV